MHGTRRAILEAQAVAANLPLCSIPMPCPDDDYEQHMAEVCTRAVAERIDAIAFGHLSSWRSKLFQLLHPVFVPGFSSILSLILNSQLLLARLIPGTNNRHAHPDDTTT